MPKDKPSLLTRIVESKPPLYWWFLLNVSMACIAVMSWLYFLPTFSYPEEPKHYDRLMKLGRAPQLPAFSTNDVPDGTTLDTLKAHTTFTSSKISDAELDQLNTALLRNYIQGIKHKKINYYLQGQFQVVDSRTLTKQDIFNKGVIVHARSLRQVEGSDSVVPFLVDVEYILPLADKSTLSHYQKNQIFDLYKAPHYCSILNVDRRTGQDGETIIHITVVPLKTALPQPGPKGSKIKIKAPTRIYPEHGLPIFS